MALGGVSAGTVSCGVVTGHPQVAQRREGVRVHVLPVGMDEVSRLAGQSARALQCGVRKAKPTCTVALHRGVWEVRPTGDEAQEGTVCMPREAR